MTRYLSVREFAKRVGKSTETIRRYLNDNKYPGAYKTSDTAGWKIPEQYVFPSGQMGMDLEQSVLPLPENAKMEPKHLSPIEEFEIAKREAFEKVVNSRAFSFDLGLPDEKERFRPGTIISYAYQIAFLCEPSQKMMILLTGSGIERALEIILVMRQSPKQPIRNPEGFVKKAILQGWKPNTSSQKQPSYVRKESTSQLKNEDNKWLFDASGKLIDWVNEPED